jgi:hypothetical protein
MHFIFEIHTTTLSIEFVYNFTSFPQNLFYSIGIYRNVHRNQEFLNWTCGNLRFRFPTHLVDVWQSQLCYGVLGAVSPDFFSLNPGKQALRVPNCLQTRCNCRYFLYSKIAIWLYSNRLHPWHHFCSLSRNLVISEIESYMLYREPQKWKREN